MRLHGLACGEAVVVWSPAGSSRMRVRRPAAPAVESGLVNGPPAARPPLRAYVALAAMTVAFGGTFVATKVALRGFEPLLIAFVRFAVAGAHPVARLAPGRRRARR